jgi:hypothetical protein
MRHPPHPLRLKVLRRSVEPTTPFLFFSDIGDDMAELIRCARAEEAKIGFCCAHGRRTAWASAASGKTVARFTAAPRGGASSETRHNPKRFACVMPRATKAWRSASGFQPSRFFVRLLSKRA